MYHTHAHAHRHAHTHTHAYTHSYMILFGCWGQASLELASASFDFV